ncbi:hypothetical protein F5Y16DRAFT_394106 [Xylariaceae sp. FL0255]|nr:hypothetical protein F5Y16DRAFT_394106 [Xylariaceae sp. FL0255]
MSALIVLLVLSLMARSHAFPALLEGSRDVSPSTTTLNLSSVSSSPSADNYFAMPSNHPAVNHCSECRDHSHDYDDEMNKILGGVPPGIIHPGQPFSEPNGARATGVPWDPSKEDDYYFATPSDPSADSHDHDYDEDTKRVFGDIPPELMQPGQPFHEPAGARATGIPWDPSKEDNYFEAFNSSSTQFKSSLASLNESQSPFLQTWELPPDTSFCAPEAGPYVLYQMLDKVDCPPIHEVIEDGYRPEIGEVCSGFDAPEGGACQSFCQEGTLFYYGKEAPFYGTWRSGKRPARVNAVRDSLKAFVPYPGHLRDDLRLLNMMNEGVIGGWSADDVIAEAADNSKTLDWSECGYWTFVPLMRQVCGLYTTADLESKGKTCGNIKSQHVCDQTPVVIDGKAQGETIWTKTDCRTRAPLDPAYQESVLFKFPEVAEDPETMMQNLNPDSRGGCTHTWWVVLTAYEIWGSGWAPANVGVDEHGELDGHRLHHWLMRCGGAMSFWNFQRGDGDSWRATFTMLPMHTNCVGFQLMNMGLPNGDGCRWGM